MTEQEAQAYAERLTRIWSPEGCGENRKGYVRLGGSRFRIHLAGSVELTCELEIACGATCVLRQKEATSDTAFLLYFTIPGHIKSYNPTPDKEKFARLIAAYLPIFRRGCWLSGCSIEATTHERAEWAQGFTREEVEAWNLKM